MSNGASVGRVRHVAQHDAGVLVEHRQEMFARVDRRDPINDFDGNPRTFDELLKTLSPDTSAKIAQCQSQAGHSGLQVGVFFIAS